MAAAREELAETKKKLAQSNTELSELRARVNDRSISPEDKEKLLETWQTSPKGTVIVKADWTDGEAQQFASEISDVLGQAGFTLLRANTEVLALNRKGTFAVICRLRIGSRDRAGAAGGVGSRLIREVT